MKVKVWTTDTEIWIEREDGTRGFESFVDYPRLREATQEERNAYEVLPYGLHWEALDEDLSFEGFFNKKEHTALYRFFMKHPELNASAIARRLDISPNTSVAKSAHLQSVKDKLQSRYIISVKN